MNNGGMNYNNYNIYKTSKIIFGGFICNICKTNNYAKI